MFFLSQPITQIIHLNHVGSKTFIILLRKSYEILNTYRSKNNYFNFIDVSKISMNYTPCQNKKAKIFGSNISHFKANKHNLPFVKTMKFHASLKRKLFHWNNFLLKRRRQLKVKLFKKRVDALLTKFTKNVWSKFVIKRRKCKFSFTLFLSS